MLSRCLTLSLSLSHARQVWYIQLVAIYFKIQRLYAYMYLQRFNTAQEQGFKSMKRGSKSLQKATLLCSICACEWTACKKQQQHNHPPSKQPGHCCSSPAIAQQRTVLQKQAATVGCIYVSKSQYIYSTTYHSMEN